MSAFRRNQSIIGRWWWTVDRVTLLALGIIIAFGIVMVTTASPAVAERIGLESFHFVRRQFFYLIACAPFIFGLSLLPPVAIRRIAVIGFILGILTLIAVLIIGSEAKGARRWLYLGSFSLQPSEFVKPFFAVATAWVLSERVNRPGFPGYQLAIGGYATFVLLLILQPDFGMSVTITSVWGAQLFLAGLPLVWILIAAVGGVIGVVGAYTFLPHVAKRINNFLSPEDGDNYQVGRSLEAFQNGGLTGTGPGEGTVKQVLPDAHTDFIFAVVGEELGAIVCLIIIALFAIIVLRGFSRVLKDNDLFVVYAVSGLLMQFGLQAIINMGVSMHLLPTKGMTLPFISYGGSSMLSVGIAMGMVLALTRRRYGNTINARPMYS